MPPPQLTPLKSSLHRTVWLDAADERVIKRFASQGLLRRLFDPLRARAESRAATALREAGLPIPEVLAPRSGEGRCEVHFRQIRGAVTLEEFARERGGRPLPLRLGKTLGQFLGRAHAAGLDHRDLHPGNVLIDESGQPWLIDFQHARVRSRPLDAKRARRDLVHLAAAARETKAASFRASFCAGWNETAPASARSGLRLAEEIAKIEESARAHHRDRLLARSRRWFRPSRVVRSWNGSLLARVDLDEDLVRELTSGLMKENSKEWTVVSGRSFLARPFDRECWRTLARLEDHGIPAARPALLDESAQRMLFEAPSSEAGEPIWPRARRLAALLGRLHDRGLDALRPLALLEDQAAFGTGQVLCPLDPARRIARFLETLEEAQEALPSPEAIETYLAEERGGVAATRALRAQLERERAR